MYCTLKIGALLPLFEEKLTSYKSKTQLFKTRMFTIVTYFHPAEPKTTSKITNSFCMGNDIRFIAESIEICSLLAMMCELIDF